MKTVPDPKTITNLWFSPPRIDIEVQRRTDGSLPSSAGRGQVKERPVSTWVCCWGCPLFFYEQVVKNSIIVILYWVFQSGHTNLCYCITCYWGIAYIKAKIWFYHPLLKGYHLNTDLRLSLHVTLAPSPTQSIQNPTPYVEVSMLSETWLSDFALSNL